MAARRTARRRVSRRRVSRRRSTRKVSRRRRTSRRRVVRRRRKARKAPIRGTRSQVFRGTRQKVKTTGQTKNELMKNRRGKIVSKKANAAGRRTFKRNGLDKWNKAFMQARKNLKIKGFVPCKKGSKLYKEAMRLYK
jgi:hypothetical protein